MSFDSLKSPAQAGGVFPRRALTIGGDDPSHIHIVTVYLYAFNPDSSDQRLKIEFHKRSTTHELIDKIIEQKAETFAPKKADDFEIFETMGTLDGKTFKERKLDKDEYPATIQTLWPRPMSGEDPSVPRNRY